MLTVDSNTGLTLARAWPGNSASGSAYEIRFTPDASRVLASARHVVELLDGGNLPALSDLESAANMLPYFIGPGVASLTPISSVGRDILAKTTPQAVRAALGLTGYAGAGIRIQGVAASVGALPSTGNTIGDAYLVGTNLYVWGGSAPWVNAGAISGPPGLDGAQIYESRSAAAAAAPNLPSSVTQISVLNGTSLEVRSRGASADDPLFATAPRWGVVQRQNSAQIAEALNAAISTEQVARSEAVAAERAARLAAISAILNPADLTDVGQALIQYEGNGRVALGQKPDGLDFQPSRDLSARIATGLQAIGFNPGTGDETPIPVGGWAGKLLDAETGLVEFTAVAGPDGLVDRFRAIGASAWRPTPRKARVLIGYGQSQSGIHQSGGEPVVWSRPPVPHHILTLDDMQSGRGGIRGHLGGAPLRLATGLVPATTLVTTQGIQDIATSMAATLAYLDDKPMVYVCRTEGRGGMPMIGTVPGQGIYKDSTGVTTQQFANFIDSANRMDNLSVSEGYQVDEITVLFDHAEADGLAGVPRAQYLSDFNDMAAQFEAAVSRPVHWLITQPVSGEGPLADNDWATRMSLHDIGARSNATLVCAKYDLPIGNAPDGTADWVHTSYKGRVILGEYYAHADHVRRSGRPWIAPWASAAVSGNNIIVTYQSELPMRFDAEAMFTVASRPQGVELGGTALPAIQSITRTGFREFTVTCNASPAGKLLRIGFSPRNAAHAYGRFPGCVTSIRDEWSHPSRWVKGFTLRRWAWGQEIQL